MSKVWSFLRFRRFRGAPAHRPPLAGRLPSYGGFFRVVQRAAAAGLMLLAAGMAATAADEAPLRIVALGDSLTAGLGLPANAAFPVKLQQALAEKGIRAEITNAGVSGDTAADGLARLDWSVPPEAEGVILELGANNALRGLDPAATEKALIEIVARLKQRGLPVLLCGMQAPRNLGPDYVAAFDPIFPRLAEREKLIFYPFFLEGVAGQIPLNQRDGIHPTAEGVDVIVRGILPKAEELVAAIRAARAAGPQRQGAQQGAAPGTQ